MVITKSFESNNGPEKVKKPSRMSYPKMPRKVQRLQFTHYPGFDSCIDSIV